MNHLHRTAPPFLVWFIFLGFFTTLAVMERAIVGCPSEPGCTLGAYIFSSMMLLSAIMYSVFVLLFRIRIQHKAISIFHFFLIGIVSIVFSALLLSMVLAFRLDMFLKVVGLL